MTMRVPLLCILLGACEAHVSQSQGWDLFWRDDLRDMETPISLEVNGSLPNWIEGSLIRNGPSQFTSPKRNVTFVYDGLAKLYKFELGSGHVKYQERFLRTGYANSTWKNEKFPRSATMGPPRPPFSPFESLDPSAMDNVNIQAWPLVGDSVGLATTDSPKVGMFDPITLKTVGVLAPPSHSPLDALQLSASHPHYLPGSGGTKLVNVLTQMIGMGSHKLHVYQMGADHQYNIFGEVVVPFIPYIHSFGVTESHMLLVVYPLAFKEMCIMELLPPLISCLHMLENERVRIFAFPFNGTATSQPTMKFEAPMHFAMHHINSFEDADTFWIDTAAYNDGAVFQSKYIHGNLDIMSNRTERNQIPHMAFYRRLTINRATGDVEMQDIHLEDANASTYLMDFPYINPNYEGRKHCFMWAVSSYAANSTEFDHWALLRVDLCTTSKVNTVIWQMPGHYPSEPIMLPQPGGAEDEGIVLAQVLNGPLGTTYLLALDARTMKEVAHAYLPSGWFTPYTQHGRWFPQAEELAGESVIV